MSFHSHLVAALAALLIVAPLNAQSLAWFKLEPRVVSELATEPVALTVIVQGNANAVEVDLAVGGTVPLALSGATTWSGTLSAAQVLGNHVPGQAHVVVGTLRVLPGSTVVNLVMNVRTAGMPDVDVRLLGPDAQASGRVVNLRSDALLLGEHAPAEITQRLYELVDDDYDFLAIIEQVRSVNNRSYRNLRNTISGIGLQIFDLAQPFGSPARLQGTISYPNDVFFDLAETSNLHEIGHNWINFLSVPALATSVPHWPLSDAAYGVMGWSCGGCQGQAFPYAIVELPSGEYQLDWIGPARFFNDLELYLMGLLPPEQVSSYRVFADQSQVPAPGAILQGPVVTVDVADVIAADGPRDPLAATQELRVATVVLSRGGLLTAEEMAFFDSMAARGEATVELPYTLGLDSGTTQPFFLATGGLGKLRTDIALRPWIDVGFGLAGTNGVPSLTGSGPLLGGEPYGIELSSARVAAQAVLVLGLGAIAAPFKGGVLVPTPTVLVFGLSTGVLGGFAVGGTWPVGLPSDATLWWQIWIDDPSGPFGWAASNGLASTTP